MRRMSEGLSGLQRTLDRVSRRGETPVVLVIDVEPDPRVFDRAKPPPWTGFERFAERLPALRERLSEATGKPAAFTWGLRMDPQVAETYGRPDLVAEKYADVLAELTDAGDEFAVHTHVWRWDSEIAIWVNDFEDPVWAEHCLTMGLEAFETAFGRGCTAHRGGDHFLTGAMLPVLERHGVKVDLTVEPGLAPRGPEKGETARGASPDYRGAPHRPYRANPDSFPAADPATRSGPVLLPLLSAPRMRPPFRRVPMYLLEPPIGFGRRLSVQLFRKPPPVIAFGVRSDITLLPELWEVFNENLEHLSQRRQISFMTASEAVANGHWD
jgi:hypothetical protein